MLSCTFSDVVLLSCILFLPHTNYLQALNDIDANVDEEAYQMLIEGGDIVIAVVVQTLISIPFTTISIHIYSHLYLPKPTSSEAVHISRWY